uniref:DUF4592 domain-containing protein n=1 Tax=Xiphophorus couchianus TaxID=32473 RepID=A0A3B5MDA3_9TELE
WIPPTAQKYARYANWFLSKAIKSVRVPAQLFVLFLSLCGGYRQYMNIGSIFLYLHYRFLSLMPISAGKVKLLSISYVGNTLLEPSVSFPRQLSDRAVSPPAVPGDFSQPASPFVCLDNSAAKHKLGLRNKACNRRKPARVRQPHTSSSYMAQKGLGLEEEEVESEKEIKQTINQEEVEEEWDSGEEEEAVELKEEPEAVEEKCENEVEEREEGSCVEVEEVRDEEEAQEEAKGDEEDMAEGIPGAEDEEDPDASSIQEEGEGDDATPEMDDQIVPKVNEEQEVLNKNSGAEEEEKEEEELQDCKSEDVERSPDGYQSGDDVELGKDGTSPLMEEKEADPEEEGCVSSRLPPLFLSESRSVSCSDQSPTSSPSKTKGVKKPEVEEKQSAPEQGDSSGQEVPSTPTDQSKVRFTVAPAWQRLQSHPTSPSAAPALRDSRAEVEAADRKERNVKAEPGSPAEAEVAPSPIRGRSSGSFTSKLQSYVSAAVAEANPDSPFGVRLRKTSALLRFGSEEVDSEVGKHKAGSRIRRKHSTLNSSLFVIQPQVESPTHPPSAKADRLSDAVNLLCCVPSEPAAARSAPGGSDPPSWISMAKQKQKVYKETPLNEITVKKAPATPAKPLPRPDSPRSSPSKPPPVLSKTPPVASPRTVPVKAASTQAAPPQRGSPPAALPQNEPPWMALAKKKAKAWSEMPQIVQ